MAESSMRNLDRRTFLGKTVLATTGLGLAVRTGAELLGVAPTNLKIRQLELGEKFGVGIIGCGNRSQAHIEAINKVEGVEVRALCDLLPEAIERRRNAVIGYSPKGYRDYRNLVEDAKIDAVVVVTPNDTHKAPTIAAFQAGKHVLCEKPMALYASECDEMIAAQEKAGKVLMIGTQRRHTPSRVAFVQRIHEGVIGKVLYAWMNDFRRDWRKMYTSREEEIRKNWRFSNSRSGGITFEMSVHGIDFCNWIMASPPVEVVGMGGFNNPKLLPRETTDHIGIMVKYANDAQLTYGATLFSSGGDGPDVISGVDGSAFTEGNTMKVLRRAYWRPRGDPPELRNEEFQLPGGDGTAEMHRYFMNAMQGKVRPYPDGYDGKMGVQIARGAEISYIDKKYLRIDKVP